MHLRRVMLTCLVCLSAAASGPMARAQCHIVDLMPAFWRSLASEHAAVAIRAEVIDTHPDLYNAAYLDLPTGTQWEALVAQERTYVEAHRSEVTAAEKYLVIQVPRYMRQFRKTFPDYRCDYLFYVAPSFSLVDGSAAFVHGQHRIIFAPDFIPRMHPLSELKVLIDHETFHIYHHESTGVFGASPEAVPPIWVALWGEGLATFVSWRMNPGVTLDSALLQPGIPEGTRIHLAEIAKDLLRHLDEKDAETYDHYFVAGRQPDAYPPRAGYYVGVLLAQSLSKRYALQELAKLNGPQLHEDLSGRLRQMAYPSDEPDPADSPDRLAGLSR